MIDETKYRTMRDAGASPEAVYLQAREDGIDSMNAMPLIARLFGLSIVEAKEVSICAYGNFGSLSEYQETLAEGLEKAFEDLEGDKEIEGTKKSCRENREI